MTIGIVDTGIDTSNPEFSGRIHTASKDVSGTRTVNPENSHGTHVALTAAAARNNSGMMGIAYEATILMARADYTGTCANGGCGFYDSDIIKGIDLAVQNGAKVINLSLGGSTPSTALRNAIVRAANAGIVVVVAAGNDGTSNPDPFATGLRQAGNGNVIIAGSVNNQGAISSFSDRAGNEQSWFLAAMGESVCCVYENGQIKITTVNGQQYVSVYSGTSFAAPQIAGAVALLRQAFPNLTATQVVNLLLTTARDAGASGTDSIYGRGIMDIGKAFAPQGTTSVAGSQTSLELGSTSLATSGAMGDAGGLTPLSVIVLDGYQRAYKINLASGLRHAQVTPRLAQSLIEPMENVGGGGDELSFGFAFDGRSRVATSPWQGKLRLSAEDARQARVLAARVAARISPATKFAFGYSQGADGLIASVQGRSDPAFLVARSPLDEYGFNRHADAAFALRHQLGGWGVTASAEHGKVVGDALYWGETVGRPRGERDAMSRYGIAVDRRFGALDATLGASWLSESRTMLGARFNNGLDSRGADSLFLDASASWRVSPRWRLAGAWRQGFTHPRAGGFIAPQSRLVSNAWAIDVERTGLFSRNDSLALRLSQPLRVASGGIDLDLPVSYSYDTLSATRALSRVSLTPSGREMVTELTWRGPLLRGTAGATVFYREDPGNYSSMPDDKGVALTWRRRF